MAKIIGILNMEPSYVNVEGIEDYRPISAASIFGRYRVADFMLSNFTNSGIKNIHVHIKNRPRSIIEHIHRTNYNINTKNGRILLLHGEKPATNEIYNTDIASFAANMQFVEESNPSYVVIAPCHFIFKENFQDMIDYHIEHKNDITMLYQPVKNADEYFLGCDVLLPDEKDKNRVAGTRKNRGKFKTGNISLETYVMAASTFVDLVKKAQETSSLYSLSDIVKDAIEKDGMKVGMMKHHSFVACLNSLKAYYEASMSVRKQKELLELINDEWPIYTMTNDSCPTLYKEGASVKGSIVANGCIIEGTVINSVIGRNVVIKEGSVVKDSVILPDALINKKVKLENCVVDRYAIITHTKELKGEKDSPLYVKRRDRI